MIRPARVLIVTEMQGRDLLRRRLALLILVALPLTFYLANAADPYAPVLAGVGMSWAVAGAALFAVLAARSVDPRLVQAGFHPRELLLGRLLLLAGLALILAAVCAVVVIPISAPPRPVVVLPGVALAALIGVPLGLAVAALLPRELEGMLTIIGVVGIELSLPAGAALASFLPLYGPIKILALASGDEGSPAPWLLHGFGYAAALFALAVLVWTRRVRLRRPTE
ncbi:MAG: hypothetical protein M3Q03_02715 [Chloroflexota bacterium]|nr:hypothetical protein [Chloroflexota bacterium]